MIPNLDHKARLVIMSAYLYYKHAMPVLSDSEYDNLTKDLVDFFDFLDPIRKFQFESPEALASTGYHIKITKAGYNGARSWYFKKFSKVIPDIKPEWLWNHDHKVNYFTVG